MYRHSLAMALAAAALSMTAPAQAAVTITSYSVTGPEGSGTFSLAFDNLTSIYSLSALNFMLVGGSTTFDTSNSGVIPIDANTLEIGGTVYGVGNFSGEIANPVDDFAFEFNPSLLTQSGPQNSLSYALGSPPTPGGIAYSSLTIAAVPEPSTWGLIIIGFAGMGVVVRRRRNKPALS